jgi:hypothetical protein
MDVCEKRTTEWALSNTHERQGINCLSRFILTGDGFQRPGTKQAGKPVCLAIRVRDELSPAY